MAASNMNMLDALMKAIEDSYDKLILQIILGNPSIIHEKKRYECPCPGCGLVEERSPLDRLMATQGGGSERDHLHVIEKLFIQQLISHADFTDEMLIDTVQSQYGWKYNVMLLDLLLKWIPEERWVNANIDGSTVLHCVLVYVSDSSHRFFTRFLEMGIDPSIGDPPATYFLLRSGHIAMLESVMELYPETTFDQSCYVDAVTEGLKMYSPNKGVKEEWINDMVKVFKIAVSHGLNIHAKNKKDKSIYHYIGKYGWGIYLLGTV